MIHRTLVAGMVLLAVKLQAQQPSEGRVDFRKDIQPILNDNCVACHQANAAAGGFRADTPEGLMRGGVSGKAIIPGDAKNSLLVQRLVDMGKAAMPPAGPLTNGQIALISAWIDLGAKVEPPAEVTRRN